MLTQLNGAEASLVEGTQILLKNVSARPFSFMETFLNQMKGGTFEII